MGLSSCVSVYDIEKIVSNHPVYLDSTRKSLVVQTYEYMLNVKYSKTKKQKREKQKKQEELHQTFLQDQESMNEIILEKDNDLITMAHNLKQVMSKAEYSSIWTSFQPEDKDIFKSDSVKLLIMHNLFNINNQHDSTIPYTKVGADSVSIHLFDHIFFQQSTSAAWKACMLECIEHYFNKLYSQLTYVYTQEDVSKIKSRSYLYLDTNLEQYDIRPRISYMNTGNRYYVQLCYWSDFGGLSRTTYRIDISSEGKADVQFICSDKLYEYIARNIIF